MDAMSPKKILVIDDDDFVRGMVCNALRKENFLVEEAQNGNEGVSKSRSFKPEVVITDMLMPDKEGIETILEIKAVNKDIKVIAMSGGGASKNMTFLEMAKKVGAEQVLSKPFKPSAMIEAIRSVLSS